MTGELTGILEVDVISVVSVLQLIGHDTQSHDLLSDQCVRSGDVHVHLWVVHLVGETFLHYFGKISEQG